MAFWCVNFDGDAGLLAGRSREYVLEHGLRENAWLMQYQYSHEGKPFQGHSGQIRATTKNWRAAAGIEVGDSLVAYLKPKRVFAIGKVAARKRRDRHYRQAIHEDMIERTTKEHFHLFFDGVVEYADAGGLYEDFTDPWSLRIKNPHSEQFESWRYPQRVDVEKWRYIAPAGVQIEGPWRAIPPHLIQLSAFEIPESFFDSIAGELSRSSTKSKTDSKPAI